MSADRFPHAPCRETDQDLWFPKLGDRHSPEQAKRICRICPHVSACLEYALAMPANPEGVWGATTMRQRAQVRR